jgi:hypothetical protein
VKFSLLWSCVLALLSVASLAYAEAGSSSGEAWYKVIAGIIGIPAAILGLVVTLNMIRKTTLESRKLELEIKQKQTELSESKDVLPTVEQLVYPLGDSQRALLLMLRFVILQLAVTLWKVVPTAIGYITKPVPYVLYFVFGDDFVERFNPMSPTTLAVLAVPTLVAAMLDLVYWVIVFGFGWPLLKDTCSLLGIPMSGLLDVPLLYRKKDRRETNDV